MKKFKIFLLIICVLFSMTCYASDIDVQINNKSILFDVLPIIQNNRTLVPMRKIFEELGCDVEWLAESQTIIATKNSKVIALQIGKNAIVISDIELQKSFVIEIDVAPVIYYDRTLVPIRVISECLGHSVDWDNETNTVIITTYDKIKKNSEEAH